MNIAAAHIPHIDDLRDVLFVSEDAMLALDLRQALLALGLPGSTHLATTGAAARHPRPIRVMILDADAVEGQSLSDLRRDIPRAVQVVVISDTDEVAQALDSPPSSRFAKPVISDAVAACVERLISGPAPVSPA